LRLLYDISDELEDDLLNNKIYGCLTDGFVWIFVIYEHAFGQTHCSIVQQLEVDPGKGFFPTLHEVVKMTVDLCSDMIYNKCQK
jgi:hypothetical protein